jgi:hypothetical protein
MCAVSRHHQTATSERMRPWHCDRPAEIGRGSGSMTKQGRLPQQTLQSASASAAATRAERRAEIARQAWKKMHDQILAPASQRDQDPGKTDRGTEPPSVKADSLRMCHPH